MLGALIDNEASLTLSKSTGDAASLSSGKTKRDDYLRPWIEKMKSWMRERAAETDRILARSGYEEVPSLTSEYIFCV